MISGLILFDTDGIPERNFESIDFEKAAEDKNYENYPACKQLSHLSFVGHRQTVQNKIRLLLKKQSDQGHPCLLF